MIRARFGLPGRFVLRPARLRWLALALLIAVFAAMGGRSRPASAQTPPPGPLLATGPYAANGITDGYWEAFPSNNPLGHIIYVWESTTYVSRLDPCVGSSAATPCYFWVQYTWTGDPADAYNTSHWTRFQRGCMIASANPVASGSAVARSRTTDFWVV